MEIGSVIKYAVIMIGCVVALYIGLVLGYLALPNSTSDDYEISSDSCVYQKNNDVEYAFYINPYVEHPEKKLWIYPAKCHSA